MKVKSLLSLALVLVTTAAFAQPSNLRRAKTSYNKFNEIKMIGNPQLGMPDLKGSLAALEKAIEHDRTKDLAETWTYYTLANADMALLDTTENAVSYYQKANEARKKALELDTDGEMKENISSAGSILAQYELNQGVVAWDAENFVDAYHSFDRASGFLPGDTTLLYYAGLAAINSQDYEKAIDKYIELVPLDSFSSNRQIILDLSRLYLMQADTANAIKYAGLGSGKYPNDNELAVQNIELNLLAGNEKEIISTILNQISKDPTNENLHYYLGIAYNSADNPEEAEKAYRAALAINPDYVEANINLGGLILNRGIDQFNTANNDRDLSQVQYEEAIKASHLVFDQALPYLQKAVDIDKNNIIALDNLLKYYQIKENQEKIDELTARIDALF